MREKTLIIENSHYFKTGQIVEGQRVEGGLQVEDHFIDANSFIVLNEAITPQDEERIKHLVRDLLKRMFYRMYTRSNFITK